jgi:hypothetical protein
LVEFYAPGDGREILTVSIPQCDPRLLPSLASLLYRSSIILEYAINAVAVPLAAWARFAKNNTGGARRPVERSRF